MHSLLKDAETGQRPKASKGWWALPGRATQTGQLYTRGKADGMQFTLKPLPSAAKLTRRVANTTSMQEAAEKTQRPQMTSLPNAESEPSS